MIVIRVELWSAIDGQKTEIARAMINNVGGTLKVGDYQGETYRGRSVDALNTAMRRQQVTRSGTVTGHRRLDLHVWHLLAKMLTAMGYGK
ncbi:MAG: hypothetical protein LCH74_03740 [Proteobacteria bacterium]|nr:hypothetical protein [Pseudomonadota bacterium]